MNHFQMGFLEGLFLISLTFVILLGCCILSIPVLLIMKCFGL